MITAVDTNVLIDILEPDPVHGPHSRELLRRALSQGSVVACEVVWAEVATAYPEKMVEVAAGLSQAGVGFLPMTEPAAMKAAACWADYRLRAGDRRRIAADFLIGGHALILCDRLLTRDRGFYRDFFQPLALMEAP